MFSWLSSCLRPFGRYARMKKNDDSVSGWEDDQLLWSKDLEKHSRGEFSFAVVQANAVLEDHSQVETGRNTTFVGVYDGHGGPEAARFICDHLFKNLLRLAREKGTVSEDVLGTAFSETEKGFLTFVKRAFIIRPEIAAIGSCCLVGVIYKGTLYIANLGDSRAVMGRLDRSNKILAEQLTKDHNATIPEIRNELRNLHPEDSEILVLKQGVWRIKGIIQVSRSIGDAYLKKPEFSLDPSFPRFHLPEPIRKPVVRADPTIFTKMLQPNDKFIIFASDGLWEHLSNQEAVEIVYKNSRVGIARRLLVSAIRKAAKKNQNPYNEIKKMDGGIRRHVHDDISIVVTFIDHHDRLDNTKSMPGGLSVRGFVDTVGSSNFDFP